MIHAKEAPSAGYEKDYVAVGDATSLSYVEMLTDEKGPTTVGLLGRPVAWANGPGIGLRRVPSENWSA